MHGGFQVTKLLLLGANGQVGTELRRSLCVHGPMVALGRDQLDLTNHSAITDVIRSETPRIIVNAAAYTAVDQAESEQDLASAINRDAVETIAHEARKADALVLHYSTDYVFPGDSNEPYCVNDEPSPRSVYGKTKLEGEQVIHDSGCRALIFRTSWVYAAHGSNFVRTMLRLAQEREVLRVVCDQIGTPTAAELIADTTSLALYGWLCGHVDEGTYHLTASGQASWHDFAQYVVARARHRGMELRVDPDAIEPISTAEYPTPAPRPANSRLSNAKLESALGLYMPDWRLHADRVVDDLTRQSL